ATRRELRRRLHGAPGVRLVVTHDPLEAAALAGRVVVVEAGRVVQDGSVAALAARPRTRYVADLVGVNLLQGRADGGRVTVGDTVLVAPDAGAGDVVAVVHPRAVALHRRPPEGSPRNVWPGVVEGVDDEGGWARVEVRVEGGLSLVAEVTAGAAAELRLAAGARVWASVKAAEIAVSPA
ncbi:MAG: TOBE domain-containing protein, partial [Actinomycetota bacterium]|nr:TOBE domain-containing protein [Actinomycetota bacterium]